MTAALVGALEQRLAQAKHEASSSSSVTVGDSAGLSSSSVMVADAFLGVIKPLAAAYASYAGAYEAASEARCLHACVAPVQSPRTMHACVPVIS